MFLTTLTILGTLALCSVTANQPEVKTPAGTFRGVYLTSHSGASFSAYRGVPYALPPTGERRFALPVRYPDTEGVRDASSFGSVCLQYTEHASLGQEDCLFLNVYTPLVEKETVDNDLKKVFVFLHGGGHVNGASNWYVPGNFVTRGDVIVVTINYRLGWLGYLRGNSNSLPGNQGFWDQILALKWIKKNIRYFGGDPDGVTLSGESAGSVSTSVLSISPLATNLFNKALFLSGVVLVFPTIARDSNDLLQIAANKFGCGEGDITGNEDTVVSCLRKTPAGNFVAEFKYDDLRLSLVSSDDEILPKHPPILLNDSAYLSDIGFFNRDYIVSVTGDDGYIIVNAGFGKVDTSSIDVTVRDISWWFDFPTPVVKLVLLEYIKLYEDLEKSLTALATDRIFLTHSLDYLEAYNKRPQQGEEATKNNAYLLSFDHKPRYVPKQYMLHALELAYLFDINVKPFIENWYYLELEDVFYEEDVELKNKFIDLVAGFMKTGKPDQKLHTKNNVAWAPYDSLKKSYLSFSLHPSVGDDIIRNRRAVWETLVPQWLKEHQISETKEEL